MTGRRILVLACVAVFATFAVAQKEGRSRKIEMPAILKKAIAAFPKLRYSGVRLVEFKEGPERKRHTENVIRDGKRSRVEFPGTSPFHGQIIIEDGNRRLHYFPQAKEIHVFPSRKEEAFERMFRMIGHSRGGVRITTAAGDTVAGLRTEQVVISDSKGNVMQRIHIEPRSGLILKRELFDRVGTPAGYFQFTKVNLSPNIDRHEFEMRVRGAKWVSVDELAKRTARENQMLPIFLGDGYKLEHSRVIRVAGDPVFVQMYRGPRGRMSLFQTMGSIDSDRLKRMGRGRAQTYAWQMQGRTFVLVGDASVDELKRLAKRLGDR